jgi:hypothetical protein
MAKYSLILKDVTFVKLVQLAQAKNQSLGKYLNELLNETALGTIIEAKEKTCFICNKRAVFEVHGYGVIFLCKHHEEYKKLGKGWKELEQIA